MASHTHRKAQLKVLNPAQVPIETKPEQLCHMVGTVQFGNLITFTDLDLPKAGPNHLYALYITVRPVVFIDKSSALNVCPLRTAQCLGRKVSEFAPSQQAVRAYDKTDPPRSNSNYKIGFDHWTCGVWNWIESAWHTSRVKSLVGPTMDSLIRGCSFFFTSKSEVHCKRHYNHHPWGFWHAADPRV